MRIIEKIKWRPRLRTILPIVNLTVLILPIGSIYFFRFYENELVRQTESELISQGVVIASIYKKEISSLVNNKKEYGATPEYKKPVSNQYYQPIPALLDLASSKILPPRDMPRKTKINADELAVDTGKKLAAVLPEISSTTLAGIRVTDYAGIVVASSKGELGLDYSHIEEVKQALSGKYSSIIRKRISDEPYPVLASISRGTGIRVFVNFPVILNDRVIGTVLLSRSPKSILKALHDRKSEVILMFSILLAVVVLLTLLISYTINRPIHSLIDKARRVTKDGKNINLKVDRHITREVAMLSDSIETMANTIEKRSDYIKDFARAVSHEFKTPLTSIGGTVELLQEHSNDMSAEKRKRFFEIIVRDTDRLKRLVERLLELAKADVTISMDETSDLSKVVSRLRERYKDLGLAIKMRSAFDGMKIRISSEILETIFTNLFDNSRQHGASEVLVFVEAANEKIIISIKDDGKGISLANRDKIFDPFFTTNRENGGTGLGLGIIKSLLNNNDGDIWVSDCESGAGFVITLTDTFKII